MGVISGTMCVTCATERVHLSKFTELYEEIDYNLFNTAFLCQVIINFKLIMCIGTFREVYLLKPRVSANFPLVQLDP